MGHEALYLSSSCWSGERFDDFMDAAEDAGIHHIELSGGFDIAPDRPESFAGYVARGFVFKVHNYYPPPVDGHFILNIAAVDEELRKRSVAFAMRAMHLAKCLGADMYSIHAGYAAALELRADKEHFHLSDTAAVEREAGLHALGRSVEELCRHASNLGVCLALENQFPPPEGQNYSFLCDWADISWALSRIAGEERCGFLLDIAHAAISARVMGFSLHAFIQKIVATGRVLDLHISGADGVTDDHELPALDGEAVRILQDLFGVVGQATLEARNKPFRMVAEHYHKLGEMLR